MATAVSVTQPRQYENQTISFTGFTPATAYVVTMQTEQGVLTKQVVSDGSGNFNFNWVPNATHGTRSFKVDAVTPTNALALTTITH